MSRLTDKGFTARAPQTGASVPEIPDFDAELAALPGGQETNAALQRWWDLIRQRIEFNNGSLDSRILEITDTFDNGVNTLQAQITLEQEVRADADSALALEIDTVSASVDGVIASVVIISSALATATGYLESRWTVNVTAGPIVTGMTLFSSSGSDTEVSYIAFQADRFQVNTASGGNKQIFSATATEVKLGSVLTVDLASTRLYIGTGTYANANTYFYVDTVSGGRMSLGDKFVWDGSTLTITGTISATTGIIGGWTVATTTLTGGNATLDSAGQLILGTSNDIVYLSATNATYRLWVGNVTAGSAAFSVTKAGVMFATGATVSGTITITNPTSFGVNYAGAASPGAAATSIVSQGALATLNSANWATQVGSRPTELTDGRITTALSAAGLVISGVTPGINVTTGSAGLYLGADFMGYYNGSAWRTYMDNSGNFYLGGTSGALQWNGTTLTVSGNITINNPTTFGVNYAGAASPGAAATSIVSQGALATLSAASWTTQVSSRPTELTDGRITTAISAAGLIVSGVKPGIVVSPGGVAGLYLGSDYLGYYNGSAWRTYMDSSGNFYLGGTGGSLQWNGTTLTIVGGGTFSGALSAATGTFAGALSAATGTFSGTLSAATGSFSGSITSTSGTIGGWSIGATTLASNDTTLDAAGRLILGTGNDVVYLSAVDATYRIWIGNATAGSAAFSVTKAGVLSATGATISGVITATSGSFTGSITSTSGTIAGFTLSSDTFSSGSGNSLIQISNASGSYISLGDSGLKSVITLAGISVRNSGIQVALFGTVAGPGYLELCTAGGSATIIGNGGTGVFSATSFSGSGASLTSLNASNLGSGTVPDARFPSTLPALNGSALTSLDAGAISSGTLSNSRLPATISVTDLQASGNIDVQGGNPNNGIAYTGFSGNKISFKWTGAVIEGYVDGGLQPFA